MTPRTSARKKVGLVGGMGPLSTIPYYHDIVYGVRERTRDDYFPDLTIESINVFEILNLCAEGNLRAVAERLVGAIRNLAAAGCDYAVLTANTAHIVFDEVEKRSPLPLISIIEATCNEVRRRGYRTVGLLGTKFTMIQDFYKKPFVREGIDVVVPNDTETEYVDKKISEELELGIIRPDTLAEFQRIIERMRREDGIEAIILGCTELPLLLNDGNSPVPCLDTVAIHVNEIIDAML